MAIMPQDAPFAGGSLAGIGMGTPDFRIGTAGVAVVERDSPEYTRSLAPDGSPLPDGDAGAGFPRVRAIGSSTIQDRQGDTMELTALQDMANVAPGMGIFGNHSYIQPEDLMGKLARKPSVSWDQGIADLLLDIDVLTSVNPRAAQLYKGIKTGTQHGISVGCQVLEFLFRDKHGAAINLDSLYAEDVAAGEANLYVVHVEAVEWSFVGIPANQRSWVLGAAKGLFARSLSPLLAPIVKGAYPREYADILAGVRDVSLRKQLADSPTRPARRAGEPHVLWSPTTKSFVFSGAYGRLTAASRDDVAAFLSSKDLDLATKEEASDGERAKRAQEARARQYGIGIKEGGNVSKPSEWASIPDSQWGDPTNYRYPMGDASHARNALSRWGDASNRSQYTAAEQEIVGGRIRRRARALGVEVSDDESESESKAMRTNDLLTKARKGPPVAADGTHDPFAGAHEHAHKAFGAQGDDELHSHAHEHNDDADHHHPHEGASSAAKSKGAGAAATKAADTVPAADRPTDQTTASSTAPNVPELDSQGNHALFTGTHSHAHKAFGHKAGAPDGDSHSHEHTHYNDTNHAHSHVELGNAAGSVNVNPGAASRPKPGNASASPLPNPSPLLPATPAGVPQPADATATPGYESPGSYGGSVGDAAGLVPATSAGKSLAPAQRDALLATYNLLGDQLGFSPVTGAGVVDMTKCDLVANNEQAQKVISIVAQLDAYTDGAEQCVDALMGLLGVRDVDGSPAATDGDSATTASQPYYATSGFVPSGAPAGTSALVKGVVDSVPASDRQQMALITRVISTALLLKEGRRHSADTMRSLQMIHDTVKGLTKGMVCKASTIPDEDQPDDEATADEAATLAGARTEGGLQATSNSSKSALAPFVAQLSTLTASLDGFSTASSAVLEQAKANTAQVESLQAQIASFKAEIEGLRNVPLPRPTSMQRAIVPAEGVATLADMYAASRQRPEFGVTSDYSGGQGELTLAQAKALTRVEHVDGIGDCRVWPEGVGPRPPLRTEQRQCGMTLQEVLAYRNGNYALVPIVDVERD